MRVVRHNEVEAYIMLTIAVYAGQDNVTQAPAADSFSSVLRLMYVKRLWLPVGLHRAEPASASACIAHELSGTLATIGAGVSVRPYHNSGSSTFLPFRLGSALLAAPAVTDVRASCFLADGMKTQTTNVLLNFGEGSALGDGRLQV